MTGIVALTCVTKGMRRTLGDFVGGQHYEVCARAIHQIARSLAAVATLEDDQDDRITFEMLMQAAAETRLAQLGFECDNIPAALSVRPKLAVDAYTKVLCSPDIELIRIFDAAEAAKQEPRCMHITGLSAKATLGDVAAMLTEADERHRESTAMESAPDDESEPDALVEDI